MTETKTVYSVCSVYTVCSALAIRYHPFYVLHFVISAFSLLILFFDFGAIERLST